MTLKIEYRPLKSLVPYVGNARSHPPSQLAKLRASLAEFGWANPMLIADGQMIAGHGRLAASLEMAERGIPIPRNPDPWMGPTVDLSHLSPVQRRAYVLQDNRSAMDGEWIDDKLLGEVLSIQAADFDLALTGFDTDELAMLLGGGSLGSGEGDAPAEFTAEIATLNVRCRAEHVEALTLTLERAISRAAIPDVEIAPAPPPRPRRKR